MEVAELFQPITKYTAQVAELCEGSGFPVKPQKIVSDLRQALAPEDIAVSDVGAHKMWMVLLYTEEWSNTCVISHGFASLGIAVPAALVG